MYTLEDLTNKKCAVLNDDTIENLRLVLNYAFPDDNGIVTGKNKYYFRDKSQNEKRWIGSDNIPYYLPALSVNIFLKQLNLDKENYFNNIKIESPEGLEWYLDGDIIKFRKSENNITYEDISKKLFCNNKMYYIHDNGEPYVCSFGVNEHVASNPNNCLTLKQAKKLLAINKLMNVSIYLNDKEKPIRDDTRFSLYLNNNNDVCIDTIIWNGIKTLTIPFNTRELAKKAINILGEETIKLALSRDWQ